MTVNEVLTYPYDVSVNKATFTSAAITNQAVPFTEVLEASRSLSGGKADLDAVFEAAGRRYNISPKLLKAVAKAESDFRPDATSRAGAVGIMQLMPGTARYLGVKDAYDPGQNIMGGAKYLREMLDKYDGDVKLALAAYNAGPGAIGRNGGVPLDSQLKGYIPKVLGYYYGSDIHAGSADYGKDISDVSESTKNTFNFTETFTQMLFINIIEMQMRPSDDRDNAFIF